MNGILTEAMKDPIVQQQLSLVEQYDSRTYGHSFRVGRTCAVVAPYFFTNHSDQMLLVKSGLLHDVGKRLVPTDILNSENPLDPGNQYVMDMHPTVGFEMIHPYDPAVAAVIVSHHEYGRRRYPRIQQRAAEERIVLAGKLVAAADVYEGLTETRAYRPALSEAEAKEITACDLSSIAPLLERFLELV